MALADREPYRIPQLFFPLRISAMSCDAFASSGRIPAGDFRRRANVSESTAGNEANQSVRRPPPPF
jgi:hypothetical protein